MSTSDLPRENQAAVSAIRDKIAAHRGWFIFLAVILIIDGIVALALPFFASIAVTILIGIAFLFAGGAQLAQAAFTRGWRGFALSLLLGVLFVIAGGMVLQQPVLATIKLTLLVGIFMLIGGIVRLILAFQIASVEPRWGFLALSGIISIALASFIIAEWPYSGDFVLGILFGVEMLFAGLTLLSAALSAKVQ